VTEEARRGTEAPDVASIRARIGLRDPAQRAAPPRRGPDVSIPMTGLSRVVFPPRRRAEPASAAPPRPETSFITLVDYLSGTDDLARAVALAGAVFYGDGVILMLTGLQEYFMKYAEEEGGHYTINLRRIMEEEGPRGVETFISLLQAYDILNWVLRSSPNVNRIIASLARSLEPPRISSQVVEEYGRRRPAAGATLIGPEDQVRRMTRQLRSMEEQPEEGEAYG